jgi:hypothetical protein
MKYIKKFNEEEKSIEDHCQELYLKNYEIVNDLVNVKGNVLIVNRKIRKFPINFGIIGGMFNFNDNLLTSLEGGPIEVQGDYDVYNNKLYTLKGGPIEVGRDFICNVNRLTSLEYGPKEVGMSYHCSLNRLTSLLGSPKHISDDFRCFDNHLKSLDGGPIAVGGELNCKNNPIYEIYKLFGSYKRYKYSLGYEYLDDANIVKFKFKEACEEAEVKMPDSIPGYKYI